MPFAYQCRGCRGPTLAQPPAGACPNCHRFFRHDRVTVTGEGAAELASLEPIREGEPVGADVLMAGDDAPEDAKRPTGWPGLDWVFDGGLPRVGTILIAAEEGAGKTTLLWQLAMRLSSQGVRCLFESSEQSLQGLRRQLKRLGPAPANMLIFCEDHRRRLIETVEAEEPAVLFLDSLHHVVGVEDDGGFALASGTPRAVEMLARGFNKLAERMGLLAFLVGHLNNDGTFKGGSGLRHTVDGTLRLGRPEDKADMRRTLSWWGKTRFGRPDRQALYRMEQTGLRDLGPLVQSVEASKPAKPLRSPVRLHLVPKETADDDRD